MITELFSSTRTHSELQDGANKAQEVASECDIFVSFQLHNK